MNDLQYSNAYGKNEISITDATSRGYNASSEYLGRGGNLPFIFHYFFLMGKGLAYVYLGRGGNLPFIFHYFFLMEKGLA